MKIRKNVFLQFIIALLLLLVFTGVSIYLCESKHFRALVKENTNNVKELLANQLRHNAVLLEGLSDLLIEEDEDLRQAWLMKDRDALFNQTVPLLNVLSSKYNVTHFYFIDLQGVCFLRVHDPASFGDTINRFVFKQAMSEGIPVYGMELGPLGILTLRSVYPWHINNKVEGYIELGEEISRITPELKKILAIELIFIIDKSLLDRQNWEQGLRAMGKTGDWNRLKDFVIVDDTLKAEARSEIDAYLTHFGKKRSGDIIRVTLNKRIYRGGFVPLVDAVGRGLGDIVVLKDVTEHEKSLQHLFIALICAYFIGGGILFFVLQAEKEKEKSDFEEFLSAKVIK